MIVFVVPLMSPKVANSWQRVSQLFERSIQSICNQTSSNFKVVVVCNQKPKTNFHHAHLIYLEVDFLPSGTDVIAKTMDRGRRVLYGLQWSQQLEPSHVMFVDADDCISNRIAAFVEAHRHCEGWVMKQGYMYKEGSHWIYNVPSKRKPFNLMCGTSNIIRTDLYELAPDRLMDDDFVLNYYGRHMYIAEHLKQKGAMLEAFPFNGAVYVVENGENYFCTRFDRYLPKKTISRFKALHNYRLITPTIRNEFNLYQILDRGQTGD
jgi:hypothetical protein